MPRITRNTSELINGLRQGNPAEIEDMLADFQPVDIDVPDESAPFQPIDFEMRDGEAVPVERPTAPQIDSEFSANLAEHLGEDQLSAIAEELVTLVEQDISDRQPWIDRFERGLEAMGLTRADIDDGPFPGASSAVPTLIAEAIVQFWARSYAELWPPDGPAKTKVYGKSTEAQQARATRVAEYLNYEINVLDEGYDEGSARILMSCGATGCGFRKTFFDPVTGITTGLYIPGEDFIVPAGTVDLATAARFTHRMAKKPNEIRRLQLAGVYRDVDIGDPSNLANEDEAKGLVNEAQDIEATTSLPERDGDYVLYEVCTYLDLPGFEHKDQSGEPTGLELPYVVTIDSDSRQILAIRRNWREGDPLERPRIFYQKYGLVPGFGYYDYGFFHLIGGLHEAATGALRVLLDSAATASLSGGFVARDANLKGETLILEPGKWTQIEASSEDLAKAFFSPPVKEPSAALHQLLGFLMDNGRRFAATTELMTGDANRQQPVGTTLALIEQGQKVMSAIHRRLHKSLAKELKLRFELAGERVPEGGYPYEVDGEQRMVFAEDFGESLSLTPVSDPNIFSSAQRLAIWQAVYGVAAENPDILPKRKVVRRLLEAMRVPDIDELLPDDKLPPARDPISEVQALLTGQPVMAYPEQMHDAHIQHISSFLQNPGYGGNPQVMGVIGPSVVALIGQHLAYAWATHARALGVDVPPILTPMAKEVAGDQEDPQPNAPPEIVAQQAAQIAPQMAQVPGMPAPQQGQQKEDPMQAAQAKAQVEQMMAQARMQMEGMAHQQRMQQEEEAHQAKLAREQQSAQVLDFERASKLQAEMKKRELDYTTQMTKVEMDLRGRQTQADMKGAEQEQALASRAMQAEQEAAIADAKAAQDRDIAAAKAEQEMAIADAKAEQALTVQAESNALASADRQDAAAAKKVERKDKLASLRKKDGGKDAG